MICEIFAERPRLNDFSIRFAARLTSGEIEAEKQRRLIVVRIESVCPSTA